MTKTTDTTPFSDPLSDLLRQLDFSAQVFFRSEYCGRWAVDTSGSSMVPFHMVTEGDGWVHTDEAPPTKLVAGQLVLFPDDEPHLLAASAETPTPDCINQPPPERITGTATRLICGYFTFDRTAAAPLLRGLPSPMVLDLANVEAASTRTLVQLWMQEAANQAPGADLAVDRLAELVFIAMLRSEVASGRLTGVVGALSDVRLGPLLASIHADPGANHSIERMVEVTHLSESALADRFKKTIGMTPGAYVRHWRMQSAAKKLTGSQESITGIAESVGYESEVAFRKAFKAYFNISPGQYRRKQ